MAVTTDRAISTGGRNIGFQAFLEPENGAGDGGWFWKQREAGALTKRGAATKIGDSVLRNERPSCDSSADNESW